MATANRLNKLKDQVPEYPDDIFKETRMPLGEHIEELRTRMIRALKWLLFFLVIGFILDGIGTATETPNLGVGKPMLKVITEPIESQTRAFYLRRTKEVTAKKLGTGHSATPEEIRAIEEKLKENDYDTGALTKEERLKWLAAPRIVPVEFNPKDFEPAFGPVRPGAPEKLQLQMSLSPAHITVAANEGEGMLESKNYLATLSAQEAFVVYFKVSLLCGVVLASPFLLYQFWAFVGAGLYPHEKKYIYIFFGPSVVLFVGGVLLCQFIVLPGAVKALLKFNEMLGFDPDIRLNEWLGLALVLPLVFGLSFQTPLVMIFFNRIGMFSAADYLAKWRYACLILALFAAIVTPTPDAVTMAYLFAPMFGLYLAGILFVHLFPAFDPNEIEEDEPAEEVAV